jgi:DNA-directed RNA polymerase specialized sigma24 family protein
MGRERRTSAGPRARPSAPRDEPAHGRPAAGDPALRQEYEAWLVREYEAWLERLRMTYEALTNCCYYRLEGDRGAAERVSMQVITGLLAKPRMFQYFGLPFSGRVAHLGELSIAEARSGVVPAGSTWEELRAALTQLSPGEREVIVLACIDGRDDAGLAAALECDERTAAARREATLRHLGDIGGCTPARRRHASTPKMEIGLAGHESGSSL